MGALAIRSNITDMYLMTAFGVIGYILERLKFPIAPMVLGVILGPLAEESFLNSMISFSNDWTVFFTRPISALMMGLTALVLLLPLLGALRGGQGAVQVAAKPNPEEMPAR
jgi:putative tricarboxylic transport membrane protein